jgi:putative PIN family toxin of toxin-antitoxin system
LNFVIDTNVLISAALIKNSIPDKAFEKARSKGKVLLSSQVYVELKEVINREKFKRYLRAVDKGKFLNRVKKETVLIEVSESISICRDPKDNMILELALSGKADCIITNDDDLIVLNPFENIPIMIPKEFLERYS